MPRLARHDPMDSENIGINPSANPHLDDIAARRFSRRGLFAGAAAGAALAAAGSLGRVGEAAADTAKPAGAAHPSSFTYQDALHKITETHQLAAGYKADIVIRWGDPVEKGAPAFDPLKIDAASQSRQFGYNNDYIGYMPLPSYAERNSTHGLLAVNHEYVNSELMWPNAESRSQIRKATTKEMAEAELAAHGLSVIEVRKTGGAWAVVPGSRYARRITGMSEFAVSGPAAGHDRLKTKADPTGKRVLGTLNNCAGGRTPWGTVLSGEENFNGYFGGDPAKQGAEAANHKRLGIPTHERSWYGWAKVIDRFDTDKEPNEPNRFGWVVEIDPYDPASVPVKRTALGRFKHEGADIVINADGRVVVHSGDDERGEYVYKFVSAGKYDPAAGKANGRLLDDGVLHVARFDDDGTLTWMPLVHGTGPLTAANGFKSQADVVIETRRAADLLGATRMDRPEDIETNPKTGRTLLTLTNNSQRGNAENQPVNKANPRKGNPYGHLIDIVPARGAAGKHDYAATTARWEIFMLCGNPAVSAHGAKYHLDQPKLGPWLAAPDNVAFDPQGRLYISTDQGSAQFRNNIPDGIYTADTEGPGRAYVKFLFGCPAAAEMCGPELTPDGKTLFLAVQHPAEGEGSTFKNPLTRWPDFKLGMPPRPSIVAITRIDGKDIGA
jgi:hypothetical protein